MSDLTARNKANAANTALVIGATGGIGSEVAKALLARGWQVRALNRAPRKAAKRVAALGAVDWVKGDALRERDVVRAARGADIIFHGANPPGYKNWRGLAIPMLRHALTAAKQSGARLVFPGNVYNYGPDAGAVIAEDAPQNPQTRKGAIRKEMEAMLAAAAEGQGVRSLIVRAGDYFGPNAPGSWMGNALIKPGKPVAAVTYPGAPEAGHAWAYLPDFAEAIARLIDIEQDLPPFETVHFGGHWFDRGIEMAEAVSRVAGATRPIRSFPWWALAMLAPIWRLGREVNEMRHLWREPLRLDNAKLVGLIGEEPHTPLDEALRVTLDGLGCLPQTKTPAPRPVGGAAQAAE